MSTISEILAKAVPPQDSVRICLRGDLQAQYEAAQDVLDAIDDDGSSLGGAPGKATAQSRVDALKKKVTAESVEFVVQAIPDDAWLALVKANPPRPDVSNDKSLGYNPETFFNALLRACLVEPVLSDADWPVLAAKVSSGQWDALCNLAVGVTRRKTNEV